ncbi:hypothetical protein PUNSTDRAFT_130765 [Punctularia strigosozonata HHB-11173 SS5]|uniref:uncharacterized protein n=1 Tax=Punctularia strigosozonata (strain HHB-11173) TaxID=741275 RepID=UPI0004416779|nr:uncharacterized protein PUNSTDRAFT_130765 [Punctularia strigosozonata HHB-11173 SS5]EIN12505.1 hypothetical protein PUNSTDRAFT_130765 [Punctularia strigosozonata HHB-11173 SS5]
MTIHPSDYLKRATASGVRPKYRSRSSLQLERRTPNGVTAPPPAPPRPPNPLGLDRPTFSAPIASPKITPDNPSMQLADTNDDHDA